MYIHGEFLDRHGETVTVRILAGTDRTQSIEIGAAGSGLTFTADPVEIASAADGPTDHLLRSSATIRLLTRDFLPQLFAKSCREVKVNILRGGACVFAGYVEPQTYSQPYNEAWDELELNCIDALSALQYSKYGDVGNASVSYKSLREAAGMRSMESVVTSILSGVMSGLEISGSSGWRLMYDGSKGVQGAQGHGALAAVQVAELLFLGDDEDGVWTQEEVLTELMRYFNLHIAQDGLDLYIYSWETAMKGTQISWKNLLTGATSTQARTTVTLSTAMATDADTQIEVGEVYNEILLNCDTRGVDDIVESPLEESALTSPYTNRQLYMRDYVVEWDKEVSLSTVADAFRAICAGQRTDFEGAWTRDWFIRVMDHPSWSFPDVHSEGDLVDLCCQGNANQQELPNRLGRQIGAALISWGSVKEYAVRKDDAMPGAVQMSTALVVSVNGNGKQDPSQAAPTPATLRAAAPVAVYTGAVSGGTYSPPDDDTTNYIVLSGSIILNALPLVSGYIKADGLQDFSATFGSHPNRTGDGGHYYARTFYKSATPQVHATADKTLHDGLTPFTELDPATVEYERSEGGSTADTVGKVAVLRCMLIVGDKCAVEVGGDGAVTDFEWRPFKERAQCASADEYYAQSFTVGFNPAIGDKLINTEFPIQNNIAYWLGIEAEGTAIPVKRSDALSGRVRFMVVGPEYITWDEVGKEVEPWSGAVTGWPVTKKLLLPLVSNIIVKDFEVKLYSDNAGDDPLSVNDLVYMSDTDESYVNRRDDLTFRIVSALTAEERRELGVAASTLLSTPVLASTGVGLTEIYDANRAAWAKAEKAYVDALYEEQHLPRIGMAQSVDDTAAYAGRFHRYIHPAMVEKTFYVQGISRNLAEASARLTLKETWR